MIEPTDEYAAAFLRAETAYWEARDHTAEGMSVAEHGRAAYRAGLAAVFELVERDRCMKAKGHADHPPARRRCEAKDGTFFCELDEGHDGLHTASLGAGLGLSWS